MEGHHTIDFSWFVELLLMLMVRPSWVLPTVAAFGPINSKASFGIEILMCVSKMGSIASLDSRTSVGL